MKLQGVQEEQGLTVETVNGIKLEIILASACISL